MARLGNKKEQLFELGIFVQNSLMYVDGSNVVSVDTIIVIIIMLLPCIR